MRQKSLLKTMLLLCALIVGSGSAWGQTTITDELTAFDFTATTTTYKDFSNVKKNSDAVYAGNSAKDSNNNIQLRSNNSNSGIVSTTSGGTIKSVKISVGSGSNTIDVYGSNEAYSSASDLYGNKKGTKVGSLSATGTVEFDTNYKYVGIRSNSGAIYLSKVEIVWEVSGGGGDTPTTYTVTYDANDGSGTMTDVNSPYEEGDEVTLLSNDFTAPSGKRWDSWLVTDASDNTVSISNGKFTMPASNVTVTAQWADIPTHTATFSINGETSTQDFAEGAAITFPANPADINGKKFMGWVTKAIDGTTDDKPDFVTSATMPTNDITYYAVFAAVTPGTATTKIDNLTTSTFGSPSSYKDWSGKSAENGSDAVYAGNSTTYNSTNIQIRSSNASGIITTTSGGKAKKVSVVWNSNTTTGRTLDIYGKNTAYTEAANLYGDATAKGTLLGSIVYGTSAELTITGDYAYLGLRSNTNAMYIESISIDWLASTPDTYSNYCTTVPDAVAVTGVTLAPTSKDLFVGDEFDLEATVAPANATYKSVTWTSSDDTKATVVNGHVTALAAGTPTITVTTTDGSFTATCDLTISNVAVTGVTLDKDAATIYTGSVGNTVQLTPTIAPANATITEVTWTSNDETKATVSSTGLVTAVAVGTATITVTTTDGNFTATCIITVEDAPGSAEKPYTVAQARAAIDAGTGVTGVYVKGIVSQVGSYSDNKYVTYWISDDGTKTNQFQVYKGLGINGANFYAATDITVGDKVIVSGDITLYNTTTYEFSQGSQLVSIETLNFAFGEDSYSVEQGGDLTITASSDNSSGAITYSSSATNVAEINATTGAVTAKKEGLTTITATIAAADGFPSKSINVTLTVTDSREVANISFANAEVFALDEDGTYTQAATVAQVDYDGTITYEIVYSTSDGASIDDATVSFDKKGTIKVKATADETAKYKSNTTTYTLKVRTTPTILVTGKSIAYGEIYTYDADSNIEGGTVTITSSNENVVVVDEYDLRGIAVGTSTITVATEADDEYIEGSKTFILTVTAPVGGTTAMTVNDVLFHETFGDNSDSAREWKDSYSVKSGVSDVYSGITSYTVSNVKQGKNTTGSTGSGLNQSSSNTDAYIIIGPLNVADYENMTLTYQWNAGSINGTYSTSAYYATSSKGDYTEISGTGAGATKFVERSYNLPAAAQVSTLYLKIVWKTSNTQGIIDEVELTCPESATVTAKLNASGYATFCSEYPLDFTNADGYTAWYISNVSSSNEITFTQITGSIKGGIGILLKGTPDANITISSANSDNTLSDNKLFGTLAPTNIAANQYYGLSGATFVKVNGGNIPAGKALLPADLVNESADGARLTFVFEEANGISAVESVKTMAEGYYNLQGQRIDTPKKGLYIVNGKKVIIK